MPFVQWLIEKGATKLNEGLKEAAGFGRKDVAEFLINKGASNLNEALLGACSKKQKDIVEFLVRKRAKNLGECLELACSKGVEVKEKRAILKHHELIDCRKLCKSNKLNM